MNLLCPSCNEMPLVKITFIKKGSALAIIKCKCGKKFHDLSTFVAEYIIKTNKEEEEGDNIIKENPNKLLYFCETCFLNIYEDRDISKEHEGHKIIKISEDENNIITKEEFDKISINIKKATDKINDYLPKMRDMLLNDSKNEEEKIEVIKLSKNNIYINKLLLDFIWVVYKLYDINNKQKTLTYQIIHNLKENSDYNLNKYNLDIKNIKRERFISYLKSCLILCCNRYINTLYNNLLKDKDELLKLIFALKPLKELNGDKTELEIEEVMKSNSSLYYGEKKASNHLAYGRGLLICSNGSHYLGYFKEDFFQEGIGKSINSEGNIYFGQFKQGIANGIGKFITKTGNIFEGYWVDNKLDGFGNIYIEKNEQFYSGELKKGTFCGIGKFNNKNNVEYQGEFNEGKMEGIGRLTYKNKKEYRGEFKEGNKNGYGIMKWYTGETYEGEWKNDSLKFGTYSWANGNLFLGNFNNDYIEGRGTFYNAALGSIETGLWKSGKRVDINHKDNIPSTRYLSFI